ncbi:helix-turn-helix domain-containing protein [Enterococcus raffinosus]|uniref:helix-turn-helix domain-containing protein n=1 Tax=Enterococcus raffinosus TaxID=71452 RepID=UPI003AD64DD3
MDILLLTQNINNENYLIEKFNVLNYGYFCSTMIVPYLFERQESYLFQYFRICFISETISDSEFEFLLKQLNNYGCVVFRITEDTLSSAPDATINYYNINKQCKISDLRDLLSKASSQVSITPVVPMLIDYRLSNLEQKLLDILSEQPKNFINRKELAKKLFGKVTPAKMSHLSAIVSKINQKSGYKCIFTLWGKGYQLIAKPQNIYL